MFEKFKSALTCQLKFGLERVACGRGHHDEGALGRLVERIERSCVVALVSSLLVPLIREDLKLALKLGCKGWRFKFWNVVATLFLLVGRTKRLSIVHANMRKCAR